MNHRPSGMHYKTITDVVNIDPKNTEKAVKTDAVERRGKRKNDNYNIEELIANHTSPEKWLDHLTDDLLPYWMKNDAMAFVGNLFPTYRTNKGDLLPLNESDWPEEFKAAKADEDTKGLIDPEHNYIRAHSRQTFAYGIAYNMTGEEKYLELCRKGTLALLNSFDRKGGMYTQQNADTGGWGENVNCRTSQDLAYGISGMAMYYYLTHDEKVLEKILKAKQYIFDNYFDEGKGIFTWYTKSADNNQVEIVAQLDQIYGYMMFLTPALPEPHQTQWKTELKQITNILIERFYSQRFGFFWGTDTDNRGHDFGTAHTDFGHSVKTMWLIYQIGLLTHETAFVIFAREKIDAILKNAYIKETGSWGRRFIRNEETHMREMDADKEWWGLAELDQACALMSINDPSYLSYLNNTYDYWFKYMIDRENGEIWHYVSAADNKPLIKYPKIHSWKNSFHSFEHALFGYVVSSEMKNKPFNLYYAFPSQDDVDIQTVSPYLFRANITNTLEYDDISFLNDGRKKIRVTFNMLH